MDRRSAFIWKTLTRSRSHRLQLLADAGLALGWDHQRRNGNAAALVAREGMHGLLVVLAPLGLARLTAIGLRTFSRCR